jgi:hypothetical protein
MGTLSQDLQTQIGSLRVQTERHERCAHFGCERPATDYRGGMPLCVGHFFKVLQWELAS